MPASLPKDLQFDWRMAVDNITLSMKKHFKKSNSSIGIIGLSGGVDSSVSATLAKWALGKRNVFALILPETGVTPKDDLEDALEMTRLLGVKYELIEIDDAVASISRLVPELSRKTAGKLKNPKAYSNIKARLRMTILYSYANIMGNAQVIGTGDKSEELLGYCTKYGDHGIDFLPIGDLYKSQVRFLSDKLGLPKRIAAKEPSPRLLKGQQANTDLGVGYEIIDRVLHFSIEQKKSAKWVAGKVKIPLKTVQMLNEMVRTSQHKREMPPVF
ncbi:MAG: NAD+ synthase [Nitrososphaerales archaeon]